VTVCDRGGVKFVKSSKRLQIQYINVIDVTFEFTGAARGFMIMSCAALGAKKVGQHCSSRHFETSTESVKLKQLQLTCTRARVEPNQVELKAYSEFDVFGFN